MSDQLASVYGLKDRSNGKMFYIGMSVEPYARYGEHISVRADKDTKDDKDIYILNLREKGLIPKLIIIEQDIPLENIHQREKHWIQHYLNLKAPLTNVRMNTKRKSKKELTQDVKEQDLWISANKAAEIVSVNSGGPVVPDYIRLLSRQKPHILRHKPKNANVSLYFKEDVEKIIVKKKKAAQK